jgi:hypothetical protein
MPENPIRAAFLSATSGGQTVRPNAKNLRTTLESCRQKIRRHKLNMPNAIRYLCQSSIFGANDEAWQPDPGARPRWENRVSNHGSQSTHNGIGLVHRRLVLGLRSSPGPPMMGGRLSACPTPRRSSGDALRCFGNLAVDGP